MALPTPTSVLDEIIQTGGANSQASSSFTPSGDSTLIAIGFVVFSGAAITALELSDSFGYTWEDCDADSANSQIQGNSGESYIRAWTAQTPSSPSSGTLTLTLGTSENARRWGFIVIEYGSLDVAILQAIVGEQTAALSTLALTLDHALQDSESEVVGAFGGVSGASSGITPGTAFTQLALETVAAGATPLRCTFQVQYDPAAATTGCDWSGLGTSDDRIGIAIEVAESSSGQTISVGLSTETDSSFSISSLKEKLLGLASETDSAFTIIASLGSILILIEGNIFVVQLNEEDLSIYQTDEGDVNITQINIEDLYL